GLAADENKDPLRVFGRRPLAGPLFEKLRAVGTIHLRDVVGLPAGDRLESLNADFLAGFFLEIGQARVGRVERLLTEESGVVFDFDSVRRRPRAKEQSSHDRRHQYAYGVMPHGSCLLFFSTSD